MTEEKQQPELEETEEIIDLTEDESISSSEEISEQETEQPQVVQIENHLAQEKIEEPQIQDELNETVQAQEEQEVFSQHEISSDPEVVPTTDSVVEAVLFASDEPLSEDRLADIVGITPKQIRDNIQVLNERYQQNSNAFRIEQIAGGYQMRTLSCFNLWLKKLIRVRSDNKLSPATLETLAIIAYKQPIIRADIEAIRGVAVGDIVRNLMDKGLVKIVGRAEVLGRPMLYGTTKKFLEVFGLNSLKDLPKSEDLKKPQI